MTPHQKATHDDTVDGWNPAPVEVGIVYPLIYRVYTFPGGCLGFQPSTVCRFKVSGLFHWRSVLVGLLGLIGVQNDDLDINCERWEDPDEMSYQELDSEMPYIYMCIHVYDHICI